jgi:hypothetical protein
MPRQQYAFKNFYPENSGFQSLLKRNMSPHHSTLMVLPIKYGILDSLAITILSYPCLTMALPYEFSAPIILSQIHYYHSPWRTAYLSFPTEKRGQLIFLPAAYVWRPCPRIQPRPSCLAPGPMANAAAAVAAGTVAAAAYLSA